VLDISQKLVQERGWFHRTKKAAELACEAIDKGFKSGRLRLTEKEQESLDSIREDIESVPDDEEKFIAEIAGECEKFDPRLYDMKSEDAASAAQLAKRLIK
jgi:hypothetical protein